MAQAQQKTQAIGGISVNLTRFGFEPSQITIPEGRFYIHIRNLTQTEAPVYSLYKNKTEKLQEDRLKKEQAGLDKILNLKEGDYSVQENTHPEWELAIKVIDPKKETR